MQELSTVHQRIRELIEKLSDGNVSAFAATIGRKGQILSDYIGGKFNKPSFDVVQAVLTVYPRLNPDWLILGTGDMFRSDPAAGTMQHPPAATAPAAESLPAYRRQSDVVTVTVDGAGKENIVLVGTHARGDYARRAMIEPEYLCELPAFSLPGRVYRNGTFRAFEVAGESMEPTLYAGDILIVRCLNVWPQEIVNGDVHVVITLEDVLVKRVLNQIDTHGSLALQSDNASYGVQSVEGDEVREVWRAVGRLSQQFPNSRYDRELAAAQKTTDGQVADLLLKMQRLARQVDEHIKTVSPALPSKKQTGGKT